MIRGTRSIKQWSAVTAALAIALLSCFGLSHDANDSDSPVVNQVEPDSLPGLGSHFLLYCHEGMNAGQVKDSPVGLIISSANGLVLKDIELTSETKFPLMIGCFAEIANGIRVNPYAVSLRPNNPEITASYGYGQGATFLFRATVTSDSDIVFGPWELQYETDFLIPFGVWWSPDGSRFITLGRSGLYNNLWLYELESNRATKLTNYRDSADYFRSVSWSPLGDRAAVGLEGKRSGILILDLQNPTGNSEISSLTEPDLLEDWPFHPDNLLEIFFYAYVRPNVHSLSAYVFNLSKPQWLDSGDAIVFVGVNRRGHSSLFSVRPDGTELKELVRLCKVLSVKVASQALFV